MQVTFNSCKINENEWWKCEREFLGDDQTLMTSLILIHSINPEDKTRHLSERAPTFQTHSVFESIFLQQKRKRKRTSCFFLFVAHFDFEVIILTAGIMMKISSDI